METRKTSCLKPLTEKRKRQVRNAVSRSGKKRYKARKKQGLCTFCGKEPPREGRYTCETCAAKVKARNADPEYRAYQKAYQREVYLKCKEIGLCVYCRKKEAFRPYVGCAECVEKQANFRIFDREVRVWDGKSKKRVIAKSPVEVEKARKKLRRAIKSIGKDNN